MKNMRKISNVANKKILLIILLFLLVITVNGCIKKEEVKKELQIRTEDFVAYLITDNRCKQRNCEVSFLKQNLSQLFPTLEFIEYDYMADNGKSFYKKYNLINLPALLFTKKVEVETNYQQIQNYLKPNNDLLDLALGATFNPLKEICDNNIDDTGNGLIDCEDSDCNNDLVCREEILKKLDLFAMSMCPYGTKALNAMEEVLENFGDDIDFDIYYIVTESPDGSFRSLHGQPEVDENIRELCTIKYYEEDYEYMDYILCRNKDIRGDWTECAEDFPKIENCFNSEEGKELLSENAKLANELRIGASPTWMANNRYQFSGIDANTVKKNFCLYNPDLGKACENELSANTGASGTCN